MKRKTENIPKNDFGRYFVTLVSELRSMLNYKDKGILTIIAFVLMVALEACTKLCNAGYEGKRCNELATSKFIASWSAVDTPGNLIYTDTISQGAVLGDIVLSTSFSGHRFNHAINASVVSTVITIPYQQPDSAGDYVQGTGLINDADSHISFTYQIISLVDTLQDTSLYSGTWTRQN